MFDYSFSACPPPPPFFFLFLFLLSGDQLEHTNSTLYARINPQWLSKLGSIVQANGQKYYPTQHVLRENFLLQSQHCVLTLIRRPFHLRVTAVARKRLRSFCQKCRWQVTPKHAYTFDPTKSEWADYAAVQAQCGNLSGNELTRNSSGNTRSQSSQLAEPL